MGVLRVGLVGAGNMGLHHARTISENPRTELQWVVDSDSKAAEAVCGGFGGVASPFMRLSDVEAVVVACPTEFHYGYCKEVIAAGKPLLVEKPATPNLAHTEDLVTSAQRQRSALVCGLLERFNPALMTAVDLVEEVVYFRSMRHSPYAPRIQAGVTEDLLVHDLDLAGRLIRAEPSRVVAAATTIDSRSIPDADDIVEALVTFDNHAVASLSASRVSQSKVRQLTIGERNRVIEVDLLRQRVTLYRHVSSEMRIEAVPTFSEQTISEIPTVRYRGEPLALQWERFLDAIDDSEVRSQEYDTILRTHRLLDKVITASRLA